ncbi:YpiF family protein [Viridibacillus sp. YIM B01967]|uniref:YpiF family protein n=1 Tax=Viridibacillus soli TaxID=2798301 RepID=A0ABS1HBA9_9BACL|nr:YpiF family protein [Viridibacillus soli]MBK3496732.1 YpiF family protein [Viridibacillus soli]
MFWIGKDVDVFLTQKEFIDTAIVPLAVMDGSPIGMKQSASAAEFLMSLTAFVEQQFKGRIMVTPPFTYTNSMPKKNFIEAIDDELKSAGFKYIFYMTSDHSWTSETPELTVLWLPSIPLGDMDQSVKQSVLSDQLRQVVPMLSAKWAGQ